MSVNYQMAIDFAATPLPVPAPREPVSLPASLVTIGEAARALGLGRSKTYELIAAGELEVVHIGRAARVPVEAIEEFVQRIRHAAQS